MTENHLQALFRINNSVIIFRSVTLLDSARITADGLLYMLIIIIGIDLMSARDNFLFNLQII